MDDNIKEVLYALDKLVDELSKNRKMNVKKDYSLMIADTQARSVLLKYKAKESTRILLKEGV